MKNIKLYVAVATATLLGFCGTVLAHEDGKGAWDGHKGGPHMMCKSARLDEKEAALCHDAMKQAFERDKASFEKMHELHEKLHAVLTAKDFDKQAFLSLSGEMQQQHDQIMQHHAEAFAEVAGKLTPEERERIFRHFHEHMGGGMMPHHGWGHEGPHGWGEHHGGFHDQHRDEPVNEQASQSHQSDYSGLNK